MAARRVMVRDPFNYDPVEVSDATGLKCEDESRTVQSQEPESNINVIVERFGITGQLPVNQRPPTYYDFEGVFDFRSAVEAIALAEDAFMSMPARVRSRFDNDPQKFVEFCSDPANLDEMRSMGLAKPVVPPEPDPAPMKVEVVNPS